MSDEIHFTSDDFLREKPLPENPPGCELYSHPDNVSEGHYKQSDKPYSLRANEDYRKTPPLKNRYGSDKGKPSRESEIAIPVEKGFETSESLLQASLLPHQSFHNATALVNEHVPRKNSQRAKEIDHVRSEEEVKALDGELVGNLNKKSKTVTLWSNICGYKITGNSAPKLCNVERYLRSHPEKEIYRGQDKELWRPELWRLHTDSGEKVKLANGRLYFFNKSKNRYIGGNCVPLFNKTEEYLRSHPEVEARHLPSQRSSSARKSTKSKTGTVNGHSKQIINPVHCHQRMQNEGRVQDKGKKEQSSTLGVNKAFETAASKMTFGEGRHDNIFEVPLSDGDQHPSPESSFDESAFLRALDDTEALNPWLQ